MSYELGKGMGVSIPIIIGTAGDAEFRREIFRILCATLRSLRLCGKTHPHTLTHTNS